MMHCRMIAFLLVAFEALLLFPTGTATCAAPESFQLNDGPDAALNQISAGGAGVFGLNGLNQLQKLEGDSWVDQNKQFRQISSGSSYLWAVDQSNKAYVVVDGKPVKAKGQFQKVFASAFNTTVVWGISIKGGLRYPKKITDDKPQGGKWQSKSVQAIWITFSPTHLYVIKSDNTLTYKPIFENKKFNDIQCDEKLVRVAAGDGVLYALTSSGEILYRCGVSADNPAGDEWVKLADTLVDISVFDETYGISQTVVDYKIDVTVAE